MKTLLIGLLIVTGIILTALIAGRAIGMFNPDGSREGDEE